MRCVFVVQELRDVTSDEVRLMDMVVFGIAINNLPPGMTSEQVHAHVRATLGDSAKGTFDVKMKDDDRQSPTTRDGGHPA